MRMHNESTPSFNDRVLAELRRHTNEAGYLIEPVPMDDLVETLSSNRTDVQRALLRLETEHAIVRGLKFAPAGDRGALSLVAVHVLDEPLGGWWRKEQNA